MWQRKVLLITGSSVVHADSILCWPSSAGEAGRFAGGRQYGVGTIRGPMCPLNSSIERPAASSAPEMYPFR